VVGDLRVTVECDREGAKDAETDAERKLKPQMKNDKPGAALTTLGRNQKSLF
jgi:hypothetical protein